MIDHNRPLKTTGLELDVLPPQTFSYPLKNDGWQVFF